MAEATQFKFGLTEIATMLLKERRIHTGKWIATAEFTFGASLMGVTPDVSFPTAIIQVPNIILNVAPDSILEGTPGLVDAAMVNPAKKPTKK